MSVGKNSISRISTASTAKKPAAKKTAEKAPKVEKVEANAEVASTEEIKVAPAPQKKPAAKKPAKKAQKSSAFKIFQVTDELPYYLL